MEVEIGEAWEQARTVFNLGTLELSGKELKQARRQARPFVRLVSREFRRALGGRVRSEREFANRVELEIRGWTGQLVLKYSGHVRGKETKLRHRFDHFEMWLPTGQLGLQVRFSLGVGLKSEHSWDTVEWWLGTWGARDRVERETVPALRQIQRRVPDLQLDSWRGIIGPTGTFAYVGRLMKHTEFGQNIGKSVETVASDLRRLLDTAESHQER